MRYVFADCVLDTTLATLHRAGRAIPLRPEMFHIGHLLLQVLEAGVAHVRGIAPPRRRGVGREACGWGVTFPR
jgi:hypothetical protein